jgi:hypothetical protein
MNEVTLKAVASAGLGLRMRTAIPVGLVFVAARDGRGQSCGTKSARSSKKKFSVPRWARCFDRTDFAHESGARD